VSRGPRRQASILRWRTSAIQYMYTSKIAAVWTLTAVPTLSGVCGTSDLGGVLKTYMPGVVGQQGGTERGRAWEEGLATTCGKVGAIS
jgi:hypothetical protein